MKKKNIQEIEHIIESVSSKIMNIGSNGVEMAQYGPISGQNEAYHLQKPL